MDDLTKFVRDTIEYAQRHNVDMEVVELALSYLNEGDNLLQALTKACKTYLI
nr:MAG TPA: hypothetical protein [Caudoviricetes sp.]